MTVMMMNIPLAVLFVALFSGIPLWLVLRHQDHGPETAVTAPVHHLPAYYDDGAYRRAA